MAVKRRKVATEVTRRTVKPWTTAQIFSQSGSNSRYNVRYARVRINMTQTIVPTVPFVIHVDREYFVRVNTNPLQYCSATFGKASLADVIGG